MNNTIKIETLDGAETILVERDPKDILDLWFLQDGAWHCRAAGYTKHVSNTPGAEIPGRLFWDDSDKSRRRRSVTDFAAEMTYRHAGIPHDLCMVPTVLVRDADRVATVLRKILYLHQHHSDSQGDCEILEIANELGIVL